MKKSLLKKIIGKCLKPIYRKRNVIIKNNGYIIRSNIKLSETSLIHIEYGYLDNSRIQMQGSNQLLVKGELENTEILMHGTNNRIILDGCDIRDSKIVVRGSNCIVQIGKNTTAGSMFLVCMGNQTTVTCGQECMLADDVEIWASDSHAILDNQGKLINPSKSISIGNHVWIGKQVAVMKGVSIGDDAIIGMRSLVTKDVEPETLNVGSPSKVIRKNIKWDRDFITKYEI